jgi:hypothetical protein
LGKVFRSLEVFAIFGSVHDYTIRLFRSRNFLPPDLRNALGPGEVRLPSTIDGGVVVGQYMCIAIANITLKPLHYGR